LTQPGDGLDRDDFPVTLCMSSPISVLRLPEHAVPRTSTESRP